MGRLVTQPVKYAATMLYLLWAMTGAHQPESAPWRARAALSGIVERHRHPSYVAKCAGGFAPVRIGLRFSEYIAEAEDAAGDDAFAGGCYSNLVRRDGTLELPRWLPRPLQAVPLGTK